MALPKKLQDLFDAKDEYINLQRLKLENSVISMQEKLLNKVISEIVSELDTEAGQIKQTTKNLRLISQLESVYEQFNKAVQVPIIKEFGAGLLGINKFETNYFRSIALDTQTKKRFNSVVSKTDEFMKARIGVNAKNEIIEGGFLDTFIKDQTLVNDLKGITTRAVTGQMPIADYKDLLKFKTIGNDQVLGGFQRYYQQNAYDEYNRYDRSYADNLSKEFKLNYAVYTGGLIADSRDFCRDHNTHVYTRDEVSKFGQWTYAKAKYIKTFHDSGLQSGVPSYIKSNLTYNPFVDLGSYQCRHSLVWVDKITAYRLRPKLKELEGG